MATLVHARSSDSGHLPRPSRLGHHSLPVLAATFPSVFLAIRYQLPAIRVSQSELIPDTGSPVWFLATAWLGIWSRRTAAHSIVSVNFPVPDRGVVLTLTEGPP